MLQSLMGSQKARIYVAEINNKIIAYKIGFLHNLIFWEFNSCTDILYSKYAINNIFIEMLMGKLKVEGVRAYNFMGGDYEYKRRWGDSEISTYNYNIGIIKTFKGKGVFLFNWLKNLIKLFVKR